MKVSVITPVFNTEKYLCECIDSVLRQSLRDIEVICVDDGSTDRSLEILQGYAKRDARIKIIHQHNLGQSIAQNKAIDAARGDYVFFLDSDDYFSSQSSLETLYNAVRLTDYQVVGGLVHIFSDDKLQEDHLNKVWMDRNGFPREGEIIFREFASPYGYTRYLYKRDLLQKYNIRFPETTFLQDALFCFPALVAAKKLLAINVFVYEYRKGHKTIDWVANNHKRAVDYFRNINDFIRMLDAASVKAELFMRYALFKNLFPKDIYAAQNVNAEFNKYVANIRQCKTLDASQKAQLLESIGVKNAPLSSPKIDLTSELKVANEKVTRYQNAYYKASAGIELTFETIRDAVLNRPVQELSYSADMSGIAFYDHDYTVVSTVFKNMVFSRRIPAVDKTVDAAFLWGNGQSPANMCAMGLGLKYNIPVFICEDGFLRSADTWCNYKADPKYRFGCSLIFDARTCYYDATKPSTVELMLNDKGLIVSEQDKTEARRIIDRIVANKLTKYNHQPIYTPQIGRVGYRKVLVVDQSYGDFAIKKGWADDSTFERMLDAAIEENPNADILVKTHPDAMTGVRKGYYDNLKEYGNVFRVTMPINPYSLMEVVDKVYVCSTQFGFEALMAGKEVHVFGMPFYAGWGLTIDDQKNQRRTNKRSLEEVFYIFYILYTHWMNPKTGMICSIDESIDYLIRLRDEYRNVCTAKLTNVAPVQEKKSEVKPTQLSTAKKSIVLEKCAAPAADKAHAVVKDRMSSEIASRDRTISALRNELSELKKSEAYRLGMFLSWPLRKIFNAIKKYGHIVRN